MDYVVLIKEFGYPVAITVVMGYCLVYIGKIFISGVLEKLDKFATSLENITIEIVKMNERISDIEIKLPK